MSPSTSAPVLGPSGEENTTCKPQRAKTRLRQTAHSTAHRKSIEGSKPKPTRAQEQWAEICIKHGVSFFKIKEYMLDFISNDKRYKAAMLQGGKPTAYYNLMVHVKSTEFVSQLPDSEAAMKWYNADKVEFKNMLGIVIRQIRKHLREQRPPTQGFITEIADHQNSPEIGGACISNTSAAEEGCSPSSLERNHIHLGIDIANDDDDDVSFIVRSIPNYTSAEADDSLWKGLLNRIKSLAPPCEGTYEPALLGGSGRELLIPDIRTLRSLGFDRRITVCWHRPTTRPSKRVYCSSNSVHEDGSMKRPRLPVTGAEHTEDSGHLNQNLGHSLDPRHVHSEQDSHGKTPTPTADNREPHGHNNRTSLPQSNSWSSRTTSSTKMVAAQHTPTQITLPPIATNLLNTPGFGENHLGPRTNSDFRPSHSFPLFRTTTSPPFSNCVHSS